MWVCTSLTQYRTKFNKIPDENIDCSTWLSGESCRNVPSLSQLQSKEYIIVSIDTIPLDIL